MRNIQPKTLKKLADSMGFSPNTAKKYIKETFPEMYKSGQRKSFFTPKEIRTIMDEFVGEL